MRSRVPSQDIHLSAEDELAERISLEEAYKGLGDLNLLLDLEMSPADAEWPDMGSCQ